ncbi:MAG: sulfurtransferase [Epsilonproteobacteria bacterium]|nr:sulfurtransferase [Campylobacterota bacterium]
MKKILLVLPFLSLVLSALPLVDSTQLQQALSQKESVVVDIRSNKDRFNQSAHIPNAHLVSFHDIRADIDGIHGVLPTKKDLQNLLERLGISKNSNVFITFEGNSLFEFGFATRLYWTLKMVGHQKVSILQGGTLAWIEEKREVSFEPTSWERSLYPIDKIDRQNIATTQDVLAAIKNTKTNVVDARDLNFYLGIYKRPYVAESGHIANAKVLPYNLMFLEDKKITLKDIYTIENIAELMKIDLKKDTIFYCDSGHISSILWFVFHELLEYSNVKLYDGSMAAWRYNATSQKLEN